MGGASPQSGAPAGRVFNATLSETDDRSHGTGASYSSIKAGAAQKQISIPSPASAPGIPSQVESFALTMLSNTEKALRESSNASAPVECWGCGGLKPNADHLYKDCPHKHKTEQFVESI